MWGTRDTKNVRLLCVSGSDLGLDCNFAGGFAVGFGIGFAGGALIGVAIGGFIKSDRWEEVPLDRLRVSVAPQVDGRFALGFSVGF